MLNPWIGSNDMVCSSLSNQKFTTRKINSLIKNITYDDNKINQYMTILTCDTEILYHYEVTHNDGLVLGIFCQEPHFQPSPKFFQ